MNNFLVIEVKTYGFSLEIKWQAQVSQEFLRPQVSFLACVTLGSHQRQSVRILARAYYLIISKVCLYHA